MVPIICRFSIMDGTKKAIYIDSFTSTSQAIETFFERISLPYEYHDLFDPTIILPDKSCN